MFFHAHLLQSSKEAFADCLEVFVFTVTVAQRVSNSRLLMTPVNIDSVRGYVCVLCLRVTETDSFRDCSG